MLDGNKVVLEVLGLVLGFGEQLIEARRNVNLVGGSGRAAHFGQTVEILIQAGGESFDIGSGAFENGRGQTAFLREERGQQMLDVNLLITVAQSIALRCRQRFLSFLGEAVDVHINNPFTGDEIAGVTKPLRADDPAR